MRVFPDDAGFCPADGSALQFASMVPVASGEDPRLGTRLCNRYELRRVVADGGMGRVYEGIDKQTQTRIAVKVLHDDVAKDDVALERFKREFEISSSLPHDHIVKVLDFQRDEAAGVWLLVMEFLDGAHSRQFIHRDLKPDNLLLCGTREGDEVKILDFGSVKDKNKDAKKLTVLGTTIGSPYYMAPEQAQGLDTLDARADVFALAAIAYECMCGVVPFPGSNGPSILLAILTKEPDPPSLSAPKAKFHIPPKMDEVMEEALAKNPNIRTKSVGALADAIGHAYGLSGDHKQWATTPQPVLAQQVQEAKARVMAPPAPTQAIADPFASPQAGTQGQQQWSTQPAPQQYSQGMDQAFANVNAQQYNMAAAGVPSSKPMWIIPVIVAAFVLVVGGGIAVFALMR